MRTTITIRADETLHHALVLKAKARGTTLSALVRDLLRAAVRETPMARRTGHLQGRLRLGGRREDAWRARLREQNWRS